MKINNSRLYILTLIAMVTWGLSWTNAKILGFYGDAPLIMFWRFVFAAIAFAPIVIWTNNSFKINKLSLRFILLNSVFMTSYNYFYFKGTQVGLAGAGGVLVTTMNPINTAILTAIIFNTPLFRKDIAGLILGLDGIRSAYETGRGKIKIRARAHIESKKGQKDKIVVTELPYQVNKANLIEKIADLVRDKKIEGITDLRDESDKDGIRGHTENYAAKRNFRALHRIPPHDCSKKNRV